MPTFNTTEHMMNVCTNKHTLTLICNKISALRKTFIGLNSFQSHHWLMLSNQQYTYQKLGQAMCNYSHLFSLQFTYTECFMIKDNK